MRTQFRNSTVCRLSAFVDVCVCVCVCAFVDMLTCFRMRKCPLLVMEAFCVPRVTKVGCLPRCLFCVIILHPIFNGS